MRRLISVLLALMLLAAMPLAAAETADIVVPALTEQHTLTFQVPDNEALRFVSQIKVGWNLGNTFDATRDSNVGDEMTIEKYWCGVYTTPEMIQALKDQGFNAIRIPVSWHNHVDADFNISEKWLSRVQEVVDYAISRDMFVILNIHHDTHKDFFYPDSEHFDQSRRYITSIWGQVAERFKDYDDKLIFESINEPRLVGTDVEWNFNTARPECIDAADCLNRLNQAFVDTVRATGGNNATRYLMMPGYSASVAGCSPTHFTLPTDTADNRLIVSVHAYTPTPSPFRCPAPRTSTLKSRACSTRSPAS